MYSDLACCSLRCRIFNHCLLQRFTQVVRTVRQAFCDQSDGRARAEAVASLLLSESYVTAETGGPTATVADTTTQNFLKTREALCLSANVCAHVYHPQTRRKPSPGRAMLMPSRTGNNAAQKQRSGASSENIERPEAKVSVESVLREMEETNQKRKRRLLRRQHRQRRRRRRGEHINRSFRHKERYSGTDTDGFDTDHGLPDEGHPWEELKNDDEAELRGHSADGGSPPTPQTSKPSTGSFFGSRTEQRSSNAAVTGRRLALGASVSILSGLLGISPSQRGECNRHIVLPSLLRQAISCLGAGLLDGMRTMIPTRVHEY